MAYNQPALSWSDSSTGGTLHPHLRDQGLSPVQAFLITTVVLITKVVLKNCMDHKLQTSHCIDKLIAEKIV